MEDHMRRVLALSLIVVSVTAVLSCGSAQRTGGVIGGAVGAVAGGLIAGSSSRWIGTLLGGAAGALIGAGV
ncbi:MAG: glycine zipper 2TM domain-containing protein, partial [Proteobacteria bacterium]|nr:glycine zipper 2TM domain-containing protein [Pseudomonadota bacterium]